uniref:Uncharacterized protein n=1 Tax=Helianthus annuus TaxID=4232 RepID=A0A251VBT4_HELAN
MVHGFSFNDNFDQILTFKEKCWRMNLSVIWMPFMMWIYVLLSLPLNRVWVIVRTMKIRLYILKIRP